MLMELMLVLLIIFLIVYWLKRSDGKRNEITVTPVTKEDLKKPQAERCLIFNVKSIELADNSHHFS